MDTLDEFDFIDDDYYWDEYDMYAGLMEDQEGDDVDDAIVSYLTYTACQTAAK